eukprot:TRINITY_DN11024_c0_g1_i5.p1 TRINITY_DN11024_c0_g1~~TRINITY_DN11024_c0_g1_i5.p1  ORF type:complete len:172 (+),score=24.48 TRINITY_DN11024_c0_g1_i5:22-537(+)
MAKSLLSGCANIDCDCLHFLCLTLSVVSRGGLLTTADTFVLATVWRIAQEDTTVHYSLYDARGRLRDQRPIVIAGEQTYLHIPAVLQGPAEQGVWRFELRSPTKPEGPAFAMVEFPVLAIDKEVSDSALVARFWSAAGACSVQPTCLGLTACSETEWSSRHQRADIDLSDI